MYARGATFLGIGLFSRVDNFSMKRVFFSKVYNFSRKKKKPSASLQQDFSQKALGKRNHFPKGSNHEQICFSDNFASSFSPFKVNLFTFNMSFLHADSEDSDQIGRMPG